MRREYNAAIANGHLTKARHIARRISDADDATSFSTTGLDVERLARAMRSHIDARLADASKEWPHHECEDVLCPDEIAAEYAHLSGKS